MDISAVIKFFREELIVIFTAMLPLVELKGAIPVGLSMGMGAVHAWVLSFVGSMLPVPFILLFIRPMFRYLRRTKLFRRIVDRMTDRSVNNQKIQKYGTWGLFIFVAIPLPGTGVWSGSLAAALLDLRFQWAFPAILFGNAIAGMFIVLLSHGVFQVLTG